MEKNVLVIEDDDLMQSMIKDILEKQGYNVLSAVEGNQGLELLRQKDAPLVLIDMKLPGMSGIEILKEIKRNLPEAIVIMMTAYGTIENAVEAMRLGSYDYLTKPFLSEELVATIEKALEFRALRLENVFLKKELKERYSLVNIVGKSKAMQDVYELIETVADTNSTVLIQGESGTGKELIAEAIHHLSSRKNTPLIKVSCASLPETLLESELFGYEKGAFTDASHTKAGRFELADRGTIFLDDIDDMTLTVQVKLLRILQEKEFERLGGVSSIKVDVRVIASTKADLLTLIKKGSFREDLYYRLNVIPIRLPLLRERKEDLPLLVRHFLDKYNKQTNKNKKINPEVIESFIRYDWPGNIRELENLVERLIVISAKEEIGAEDVPKDFLKKEEEQSGIKTIKEVAHNAEINLIKKVLAQTGWRKSETARILGISQKTLWQKMKQYKIKD